VSLAENYWVICQVLTAKTDNCEPQKITRQAPCI